MRHAMSLALEGRKGALPWTGHLLCSS
jgi:hypothetical protein